MGAHARKGQLTVLVTGVGAPPGVSIFKAFRQSALRPRIVATDAEPLSVGLFRADAAHVLPRIDADEAGYLRALVEVCIRERVALVCLGSELELERVAPYREAIERRSGARLVVNAPERLRDFMDKWRMVGALRGHDLPVPDTALLEDRAATAAFLARQQFPVIVKPRRGSGSRHLHVVHDAEELDAASRLVPDAVIQEYLLPDDEEYTVGVYRSPRAGYVGQIVFRRRLAAGLTYKAEVVHDPEIEGVCRRVVEAFELWGPVNVQLRKTARGVRVFEINPRFSSSAVMRAGFGFNEAEMCLRDLVLGEALQQPEIRPGYSLRFWDEVFVTPEEYERVRSGAGGGTGRSGTRLDDF